MILTGPASTPASTATREKRFGYEAAATKSGKRIRRKVELQGEDRVLSGRGRQQVISDSRDLRRNFAVAGWAMRLHCAMVAQFSFQARTDDEQLNEQLETLMRRQSRAMHCDAAGRHSLGRLIQLAEMGRLENGDAFVFLYEDGKIAVVEGDRIGLPDENKPDSLDEDRDSSGIRVDAMGRIESMLIGHRDGRGRLVFDRRWTEIDRVVQHGFFDRPGQLRGVSPLAAAMNNFQDIREAQIYALARAKLEQMLGLKVTRAAADPLDGVGPEVGEDGEAAAVQGGYRFDFSGGPLVMDLEPGDDAAFLTAQSPHANFRDYLHSMLMASLKALDIDFSLYDSAHTNYSGARMAREVARLMARPRRADVVDLLTRITDHWLELWARTGELQLPAGLEPADLRYAWLPAEIGHIDPLKEVRAQALAVEAGLASRQQFARESGRDWHEQATELASEQRVLEAAGLIVSVAADATQPEEENDA